MRKICRSCDKLALPLKGDCVLCQWILTKYPAMYVGNENLTLAELKTAKEIESFPYID